MSSVDRSLLGTFQKHVEDMRNLTCCKICLKPFYEPFVLQCGHTYCYGCLRSWFCGSEGRNSKRNCPDCRAKVTSQPAPNYLLRDLVHMFINRAELLPEDESVAEHDAGKAEEAALLAGDRARCGPFRGAFQPCPHSRGIGPHHQRAGAIHDQDDNVDRCPVCTWELEDGACFHCGWHQGGDNGDDFSDEDSDDSELSMTNTIDSELDDELEMTDHDFDGHIPSFLDDAAAMYGVGPTGHHHLLNDEGEMDDFLDDEDDEDDEDSAIGDYEEERRLAHHSANIRQQLRLYEVEQAARAARLRQRPSPDISMGQAARNARPGNASNIDTFGEVATSEDSDDDTSTQQTNYDESETDESESDVNVNERTFVPVPDARQSHGRPSARVIISDDSDEAIRQGHVRRRPTTIISDDSDEDEEEQVNRDATVRAVPAGPGANPEGSETSDTTTVGTPQPPADRRRRLDVQRARRGDASRPASSARRPHGSLQTARRGDASWQPPSRRQPADVQGDRQGQGMMEMRASGSSVHHQILPPDGRDRHGSGSARTRGPTARRSRPLYVH